VLSLPKSAHAYTRDPSKAEQRDEQRYDSIGVKKYLLKEAQHQIFIRKPWNDGTSSISRFGDQSCIRTHHIYLTFTSCYCSSIIYYVYKQQPNIRRTFPGRSTNADDEDEGDHHHHPPVYRGGGKQFGKSLRPAEDDDDSDDDDSEDEEEEEQQPTSVQVVTATAPQQQYAVRGSGKQLGGSGKYLRPYVL
jgi:hypothetical protein